MFNHEELLSYCDLDLQTIASYTSGTYSNLLHKAEKPSVCLSVLIFWHADILVMSASIETRFAENQSCAYRDQGVYFYKPTEPTIHQQEYIKD